MLRAMFRLDEILLRKINCLELGFIICAEKREIWPAPIPGKKDNIGEINNEANNGFRNLFRGSLLIFVCCFGI
jgi:hypothetical protein